ncbi:MAG TPA: antibiotic biosynthesis monooxygenase [Bacillota bacterium]|nr:antibiotic biosynthesis monooxygenase [Bacillota bacterium]
MNNPYHRPIGDANRVLLVESWTNVKAQAMHSKTEHFKKLAELKNEYVEEVRIKKYQASNLM